MFHLHHVVDWNAFRNANNQIKAGIDALEDRIRRKRRGHKDHRHRRAGLLHGLVHGVKNRHIVGKDLTAFARRYSGGNIGSIVKAELRVPRPEASGNALNKNSGFRGDKNCHSQKDCSR